MTLKELQDKRLALANQLKELGDRQEKWTSDDETSWTNLNAEYDANKTALDQAVAEATRASEIRNRLEEVNSYLTDLPSNRIGRDGGTIAAGPKSARFQQDSTRGGAILTNALHGWLMAGSASLANKITDEHRQAAQAHGSQLGAGEFVINLARDVEQARAMVLRYKNAMSGQEGTAGGFTKDETLVARLEMAMLAFGGVARVAETIRTDTGEPMRWPTIDDTANTGRQVGENQSHDSGTDPEFGSVYWNAYTLTSDIVKVPNELMQDSVFNLASLLGDILGERLGRIQNTKATTGTGAATYKGIVTCATAGVTAASQTAIAFDELIDLEHSLDPSRRNMPGVGYMFHDAVLKALRKLKDGEGRYLWQAGANSGAPDTLNTYPYTINQDMASSIASGAVTMLFGQMSAYKIRQVAAITLRRLNERFADTNQTGFLAILRGDGNLLDAGDGVVRKLTQA